MNDEVNLFNYWNVIVKRKRFLFGVFITITLGTAIVNYLKPKIYRGEYMVNMATYSYVDIVERINSNDKMRLKEILPETYQKIEAIELTPLPDTVLYKLKVMIEAKDTADIHLIKDELFNYILNFPYYKKSVENRTERLQKELNDLSKAIAYPEEILRTYNSLLKSDKLVPIVFNPVDLYMGMANLVKRKTLVEQFLKNQAGMEIVTEEIMSSPVKPMMKRNVILAALIGIFAGIFLSFIAEFAEKVNRLEHK